MVRKKTKIVKFEKREPIKILFLTNNYETTGPLCEWLMQGGHEDVKIITEKITKKTIEQMHPHLLISYDYKHIIGRKVLSLMSKRVIGLHTSLLPWNRGLSPNLWSFLEDTPKGVSIYLVDKGINTGPVLIQKKVTFNEEFTTLFSAHKTLHKEIQLLFKLNWEAIRTHQTEPLCSRATTKTGSFHGLEDFKKVRLFLFRENSWHIRIETLKRRYQYALMAFKNQKDREKRWS